MIQTTEDRTRAAAVSRAAHEAERKRLEVALSAARRQYERSVEARRNGDLLLGNDARLKARSEIVVECERALHAFLSDPRTRSVLELPETTP